jgi:threonine dehydrogenase-like Zn-dependent dehydrogenase
MSELVAAPVAVAPLQTEIRRFPLPETRASDGLLEVEACGVCGTDWEIYERRSRGRTLGALILGHETVGRIAALGDVAAERWEVAVGDRVVVEEFLPCGVCSMCRSGRGWLCDTTDSRGDGPFLRYGSTPIDVPPGLWGGFAPFLYLHPNAIVHPILEDIPAELAALFVPISNGLRWVGRVAGAAFGSGLLVQGPGQHGLGCVVAARAIGMSPIVVAGLDDGPRLEVARGLGADVTVDAAADDVVARTMDATDGRGVDVVVDLAPGAPGTVETAIAAAAKNGTVVLAASKRGQPVAGFSNETVVRKELTVRGVRGRDPESVDRALDLIASRRFPLELMCTHSFPMTEVDKALRLVGERWDPAAVHVDIVPGDG